MGGSEDAAIIPEPSWRNDALVLIAHGSARYPDAARTLCTHAAALRSHFAQVATGLLNGSPSVAEAIADVTAPVVHVVPFFIEQGWFVRQAIPRALSAFPGRDFHCHPPVGLHPGLPDVAAARAVRACGPDAPRYSILLVGHGSARTPGRRMALHRHVNALSDMRRFRQVRAAFLEEPPLVADALGAWRSRPVAVLGFLAGDGAHVREDLPALLAAERAHRDDAAPLLDLGTIGDDPAMPRIILDQVACPGDCGQGGSDANSREGLP
ncbi:MAG TPA: CbiX/SirB N-terminal domain-containing protein [Acetobacteraceae bacterium]|nr:CbiX/SirB N-terminal domain-containing protein [Acetobacteraceae bacterium]